MRIHNVIGSSKISASPPKPYGSWLSYWEDKAEFKLKENTQYECPACGAATFRRDFDGCHVQNLSFMDKSRAKRENHDKIRMSLIALVAIFSVSICVLGLMIGYKIYTKQSG